MSAVRPNAQQLPREGGIRSVVRRRPRARVHLGGLLGVELRGAAALSQDPTMMHMIAEEDAGRFDGFHWAVAAQAFGEGATKADRYMAKRGVFGHIYGGGVATLARRSAPPRIEMAAVVESLKVLTPAYPEWSEQIRRGVRQGRPSSPPTAGGSSTSRRPIRTRGRTTLCKVRPAKLLVDALIRWRDTRWGDATLLPVHDELVIQVPAQDAETATAELVRCMEGELYGVHIAAEASRPAAFWQDSV
jgi:DNA polymerase I-like protein with 3'-5' exonuclease and polymerase domains